MMRSIVLLVVMAVTAFGFAPSARFGSSIATSRTRVFEDFNLDFKNPDIISSPEIFSEKQLREYTAQYSVDERFNVVEWALSLFKKKDADSESSTFAPSSGKLKPTVSVAVLEEKTAQFVQGKSDAKTYYGILNAAFGSNLKSVLPQILANLPTKKSAELSKIAK